jgi:hypothetical protein
MTSNRNYHSFFTPEDSNVKVWRYMDFTKFVSMLQSRNLFLSRLDKLGDPYEGATSHANAYAWSQVADVGGGVKHMSEFMTWIRQWVYVNCWHMNSIESDAMWKLYAQTGEAVAIQSRYSKLVKAVDDRAFLSAVKYIDYESEIMQEGSIYLPFFHKRLSFKHENEVRIAYPDLPLLNNTFDMERKNEIAGLPFDVQLDEVIEKVFISPTAPPWFKELVIAVIAKFGYRFDVQQSNLSSTPRY